MTFEVKVNTLPERIQFLHKVSVDNAMVLDSFETHIVYYHILIAVKIAIKLGYLRL